MVVIVYRLAIIGLRDQDDAHRGRGVFRRHDWEGGEGEMRAVWRRMMREESKRDRKKRVATMISTHRRPRSDEAIDAKSTWLALFSPISENYLQSISLASGAQGAARGDRKHKL